MAESSSKRQRNAKELTIVIAGGVGTGKSSAIRALTGDKRAVAGKAKRGMTKTMELFTFEIPEAGITVKLCDVPGIGDMDIKTGQLFKMYEDSLKGVDVDALLLFVRADLPRFDLTGQMLVQLMDIAFPDKGAEKWKSFIVVGTHKDKAGEEGCADFKDKEDKEGLAKSIEEIVTGAKVGHMCCTSIDDTSELIEVLKEVAKEGGVGKYELPSVSKLVGSLCKVMAVPEEEMVKSIAKNADSEMREFMQKMLEKKDQESDNLKEMLRAAMNTPPTVIHTSAPPPPPFCSVM